MSERQIRHNKRAPYWAAALITFCSLGLSSSFLEWGDFWSGYLLDMTGPAWNYILVRLLFTEYVDNAWTRFFSPTRTFVLFVVVAYGIEGMQYFDVYDSVFDPLDLVAYVSLLLPVYLIDSKT